MEYGTPAPLEDSEDSDPFLTPFLPSFFGLVWVVWSGLGGLVWWTGGLVDWPRVSSRRLLIPCSTSLVSFEREPSYTIPLPTSSKRRDGHPRRIYS